MSHWVAAGPPLAAADAARAEHAEWLPANILSAGVHDRSMSVDAAHLRVRDAHGAVVWEYGPFSWRTSPQRTLPIGTYQVELSIAGRSMETRTVELQQAERGVEVKFQLQQ